MVRAQSGRRGDRLARSRSGRGRGRRRDELLPDGARRLGEAPRDPGQRRDRSGLSRPGDLLDTRARERGRGRRAGLAGHRHVPERQLASDLHPSSGLGGSPEAPALGAAAAARRGCALRAREAWGRGRRAARPRSGAEVASRPGGASDRVLRRRHGRARHTRERRLREPLRARRRLLQLALPRLASRLPLFRRLSRRAARRRGDRRAHIQARRVGRLPRRSRGGARRLRPRSARCSRGRSRRCGEAPTRSCCCPRRRKPTAARSSVPASRRRTSGSASSGRRSTTTPTSTSEARPGTSRSGTSTSSERAADRLHHAAGGSRPPRTCRNGAQDRRARGSRRRGRGARGRRGRRRAPRELPRQDVSRLAGRRGAAPASRRRSRASSAASAKAR